MHHPQVPRIPPPEGLIVAKLELSERSLAIEWAPFDSGFGVLSGDY